MKVCSELGDLNSHLVPFNGFEEYEYFYKKSRYFFSMALKSMSLSTKKSKVLLSIRTSQLDYSFTVFAQ